MHVFLLIAALAAAPPVPSAPTSLVERRDAVLFTGRVLDSLGGPLVEARIVILEANRSTLTDAEGRFRFDAVPEGNYGVSVAAIGYRPRVYRVGLLGRTFHLEARLLPSVVELPGIQTTATPLGTSVLDAPQPLSVLHGAALQGAQAASLGAVLEGLPGLRNLSTGNGIGKPVIRGLTSNRVLILDNGQRVESQQWGDEHAPSVETAGAERVEVIRGPASVLYGSDALGGVINVVQRELPDATDRRGFVRGTMNAGYASNGRSPDGVFLVEGAAHALGFRATLSGREQGDVRTPGGVLQNSGLAATTGSGALGYRGGWGSVTGHFSRRVERVELHQGPAEVPEATPFQRIATSRGSVTGNIALGGARLEVDLGAERNQRREFEERGAPDVALGLLATTLTASAHLHQSLATGVAGVLGISAMLNSFEKFGSETLVPDHRATTFGVYGFAQMDRGVWQFTAGARLDRRELTNAADADLGLPSGRRQNGSVTGNMGALFRVTPDMAVVANVGRGFRAPSAFELFSDGVHEGSARYEIGDPRLRNETSFNLDLALRIQSSTIQGELGVFRNAIQDYIYPDPTARIDQTSGFRVYEVSQGNAVLTGVEATMEYHPTRWLHLTGGGDVTRGQNTTRDIPLAFVAPLRLTGSVRVEGEDGRLVQSPYAQVGWESNAQQRRLDPEDIAPAGYALGSLGVGGQLHVAGRALRVDVRVRNLFDARYRNFLSRYKFFADDPGRSISLRLGVDF